MKVHCRRPGDAFIGQAWCGRHRLDGDIVVESSAWDWLPATAFCGSCARSIEKPNGLRDSWLRPQGIASRAELELAIEAGLHNLVRHMQTWPDAWHVDPHGTGNNPHVWFDRIEGWPSGVFDQVCPCGAYHAATERRERAALRAQHTCTKSMSSMNCRACNNGVPYPHATIEEILGGMR